MFSLIIAIAVVALVSLLAAASIYYGGDIFGRNSDTALQARIVNQAGTIQGAVQLYKTDHQGALPPATTASQALVQGKYLSQWPTGGSTNQWAVSSGYATTAAAQNNCLAIDRQLGLTSIPLCSDPTYQDTMVCCGQ